MKTNINGMSAVKLAYAARELENRRRVLDAEPIAVIGMACRFPGQADNPSAFWELLAEGRDCIREVPADRWDMETLYDPDPKAPGKMYCKHGGFLDRIDLFDPAFFGLTPREANAMDPQHRLLLEVAWEAVCQAKIDPKDCYGSRTGVFMGLSTFDFAAHRIAEGDRAQIDPYFVSGTVLSAAAGRLSYLLGLTGPSFIVDTACSSSLVALHQACNALRRGECTAALTGGVGLIMAPEPQIAFCKAGMLATDGRCKTFDAGADGYGRGEGCGVLVLKKLSRALADGDPVLALIRGSAVNQDGASGGLTVPHGPSQENVVREALAGAGLNPEDLSYVEAHGTGTPLGDPIEVGALAQVFNLEERDTRLHLGSVKTNFGHLEAAAGVAGIIKTILAMKHRLLPRHLHFREPNPKIAWNKLNLHVPRETTPWQSDGPLRAGVSSFGFAGTNAFVVLESFDLAQCARASVPPPTYQRKSRKPPLGNKTQITATGPGAVERLPGRRIAMPGSRDIRFQLSFRPDSPSYVPDHKIFGHLVIAGASHLAFALEACNQAFHNRPLVLENFTFQQAMVLENNQTRTAQLVLSQDGDHHQLVLYSGTDPNGEQWTAHVKARVLSAKHAPNAGDAIRPGDLSGPRQNPDDLYQTIADMGHHLGDSFRRVRRIETGGKQALIQLSPPETGSKQYRFHPGLLDSSLQYLCIRGPELLFGEEAAAQREEEIFIPFFIQKIHAFSVQDQPETVYCHVDLHEQSGDRSAVVGDLHLFDENGRSLLFLEGFNVRRIRRDEMSKMQNSGKAAPLYQTRWIPTDPVTTGDKLVFIVNNEDQENQMRVGIQGVETVTSRLDQLGPLSQTRIVYWSDAAHVEDIGAEILRIQKLITSINSGSKPLGITIATRNAQTEDKPNHGAAALWGLGRVLQHEFPGLNIRLADHDGEPESMHALATDSSEESECRYEAGQVLTPRLQPLNLADQKPRTFHQDGAYLISGGNGALGLACARRFAELGAGHIILVSRNSPDQAGEARFDEIRSLGASVQHYAVDITNEEQVQGLFRRIDREQPPLKGVVHAAGLLEDGLFLNLNEAQIQRVLTVKTLGALNLHNETKSMDLDFFVLFGSMTAVLGRAGQAAYGAGNAYMGALARLRQAYGLPATCIHWCGWSDIGMAARLDSRTLARLEQSGIGMIDSTAALDLMLALVRTNCPDPAVLPMDWRRYASQLQTVPSLLRDLVATDHAPQQPALPEHKNRVAELRESNDPKQGLQEFVAETLCRVMALDHVSAIAPDARLYDLGLDSIMVVDLQETLEQQLSLQLTPTLVFNHPTLDALVDFLFAELNLEKDSQPEPEPIADESVPDIAKSLQDKLNSLGKWIDP